MPYERFAGDLLPLLQVHDEKSGGFREKEDVAVLVLGCGNSPFSAALYDAGFTNITSIDFSSVVIEKMTASATHGLHNH
jgi:hypothetical protein